MYKSVNILLDLSLNEEKMSLQWNYYTNILNMSMDVEFKTNFYSINFIH